VVVKLYIDEKNHLCRPHHYPLHVTVVAVDVDVHRHVDVDNDDDYTDAAVLLHRNYHWLYLKYMVVQ